MLHVLTWRSLNRPATQNGRLTTVRSDSVDFEVSGASVLNRLAKANGGHADFMGCFVSGLAERNQAKVAALMGRSPPDTTDGRVLLYVCPECGDVGCGAYAVRVLLDDDSVEWSDFAYENGYEPAKAVLGVGPFRFSRANYEQVLAAVSAA